MFIDVLLNDFKYSKLFEVAKSCVFKSKEQITLEHVNAIPRNDLSEDAIEFRFDDVTLICPFDREDKLCKNVWLFFEKTPSHDPVVICCINK